MTTQELERTRQAWEAIAEGYDEFVTPTHMSLGGEALVPAGLAAGLRFLDVAAGSGALSLPAARLGALVTATDITPAMIERLAGRASRGPRRRDASHGWSRARAGRRPLRCRRFAVRRHALSRSAAGAPRDEAGDPARRPRVPGRLRRADADRVPGILHGGDPGERSRLHGASAGPAAAAVPGGGSRSAAAGARGRRAEGRPRRNRHAGDGVPFRWASVGLDREQQPARDACWSPT